MANLIIDIGNTFCKVAVFENQVLTQFFKIKDIEVTTLKKNIDFSEISLFLVSSTRQKPTELLNDLSQFGKCLWLEHHFSFPFTNKYATPDTLGKDRLALAASACLEFKNKDTLVIDAGTCITYDIITSKNEYLGGAISPGLEMRFKALNTFTEKLPLLEPKHPEDLIGKDTQDSILSGIVNGTALEIDGVINEYKKRFPNLNVVLTGGDQLFFAECIKNNFFARPEFLLKGLNYIAELNA
ncbi:MAG: type III pantothenate kinase [Schleiferiaceae bacterium]|jgi:type III pantothenate kinase|nr:type III pantothenate kinase [Schleiferiaceae bacterium]